MSILQSFRLLVLTCIGRFPITVRHFPNTEGPQWCARIPGTALDGWGWTYDAAIGTLINDNRHELGFKIKLELRPQAARLSRRFTAH